MIIRHDKYLILSANSNTDYWATDVYPDWATLTGIVYVADGHMGDGIEPHYHDCDEFWIFSAGKGEGWMDGQPYEITPNTAVYNPMGVVHRHQQFTTFSAAGLIAHRERQQRSGHLSVEEAGLPQATIPGFVVPGVQNTGAFVNRGTRCPLSELRMVRLTAGENAGDGVAPSHEYWFVTEGRVHLVIDGLAADLVQGDLAMLRSGVTRRIHSPDGAQLILARE